MPKMKAAYALMETLLKLGVKVIFGNPGSSEVGFMEAVEKYPEIDFVLGLHEGAVIGMAEGYARASRTPAVTNVHIAPGLANSLNMIYDAYRGNTPIIITAGQQDQRFMIKEPMLTADLVNMARPFTKWSYEVYTAKEIPLAIVRAYKTAIEPPAGPVFLSLPENLLAKEEEFDIEVFPFLNFSMSPPKDSLDIAASLIIDANHPVIIGGDGIWECNAQEELIKFADLIGAEVYSMPLISQYIFPSSHPLYFGNLGFGPINIKKALNDSDLIIIFGMPLFNQITFVPKEGVEKRQKIIHFDLNIERIGRNFPQTIGIPGDIKKGLNELNEILSSKIDNEKRKFLDQRKKKREKERDKRRKKKKEVLKQLFNKTPISIPRLFYEINELKDSNTAIVDESISYMTPVHDYIDFSHSNSYFGLRGGGLGFGIPAAIGVKLALPDINVVALVGDGSALYTIQGLWSAAHLNLPVKYIILNNRSYRIVKINMIKYGGKKVKFTGMDLKPPLVDFISDAKGFNVDAKHVESPDKLKDALLWLFNNDRPSLLDVVVDPSYGDLF